MRKIETHDVFKMARIIKTAGIRKEISDAIRETQSRIAKKRRMMKEMESNEEGSTNPVNEEEDLQESIGAEIFFVIAEACSSEKLEEMLYDFMGGIAEKSKEEIAHMPLDDLVELFKVMAKENNIFNFFNTAGRLAQK